MQDARRALQKLFGKPCTLTLLRHSYISHMLAYCQQLTIRDREQLAAEMCHSPATQAQYQWIVPRQRIERSSSEEDKIYWTFISRNYCWCAVWQGSKKFWNSQSVIWIFSQSDPARYRRW